MDYLCGWIGRQSAFAGITLSASDEYSRERERETLCERERETTKMTEIKKR